MRRFLLPLLARLLAAVATAGLSLADDDRRDDRRAAACEIGLWGHLPYSAEQRATGMPDEQNGKRSAEA